MTISRIGIGVLLLASACQFIPGAGGLDLNGRAFLSSSVTEDGAPRPLVDGTQIRLDFADGMIGASAGCNHFGGTYRIDGGVLIVTGGAMTEMGCDSARHEQDDWLLGLLGAQPLITLDGDELRLEEATTVITLVDREVADPNLPLVGPTWTLTSIISGDAVSSMPAGVVASLAFTEAGLVMVNTGCNTGTGTFEVVDGTVRFGPIAVTERACDSPVAEVEQAVLEVLGADVVAYQIEARSLTLTTAGAGLGLDGVQ